MNDGPRFAESEKATTSGNFRKDLSEWQERHASLVLSSVKVQILYWILDFMIHVSLNDYLVWIVWGGGGDVLCAWLFSYVFPMQFQL